MSRVDVPEKPACRAASPAPRTTLVLFLVSVLGLFLELLLIRWIGTEIRLFAYLQNTILVVCFMGLGMGCLTCRKPASLSALLLPIVGLTVLLALPPSRFVLGAITELLTVLGDYVIWGNGASTSRVGTVFAVASGLGLTLLLLILVWDAFVPIGRLMGRLMDDHPSTIRAYSINVLGGLVGVWLFAGLSALGQPPVIWFLVLAALTLPLVLWESEGRARRRNLALLGALVPLVWLAGREPGAIETRWSPYQKLVLKKVDPSAQGSSGIGDYLVNVNNCGYQGMLDLSAGRVASDEKRYPPAQRGLSQYDLPFLFHPRPRTALIVGAGTGNDAAGALRNGVDRVTAVEIDPAIIDLGRRYHPERPYDSPRVTLVNDDARSFFGGCNDRFDVVSFGLLDSHTTGAMMNARLDHFVYTHESLIRARSLLADGGVMVLSFEAAKPFIADRIASDLRAVFGAPPLCFRIPQNSYGWGGVMFVAGDLATARRQIARSDRLAALIDGWQKEHPVGLTGTTRGITDDWPYIYLESPRIPALYVLLAGLLVVLLVRGARTLEIRGLITGWDRAQWHFFFLGAAFLLLEVQNISKASVVLGNTWIVSAVIISSILVMVLLANLTVVLCPRLPSGPIYAALVLICLGLGVVDIARFAALPAGLREIAVGGLTSLPMYFSGIVFIRSFAATARKDEALGANLFGALMGGILQSITFLVGIRALLLVVAGFYVAALLTRPRSLPGSARNPSEPHDGRTSAARVADAQRVTSA